MKEKYSIFHIQGGLGKHIAASAVAKCIKNNHPSRKLIVVSVYTDVFMNLPFVDRVYQLNNTNYFYEEDKIYYESKGLTVPPTGQEGVVHKTNIRLKNSLPISDAIVILSKFYSTHMNGKICVANKNSALYPTLDYYEI